MIRLHRDSVARWLSGVLPAVVLLLVALFSVMVIRDYGRESAAARQTLLEKGNVLIRALESGSRVGMGMRMHHAQQQTLLEEMAGQPGVLWFALTDARGNIITHSDPNQVGKSLYSPDEMRALNVDGQERWRHISVATGGAEPTPALEIYREFQPLHTSGKHAMPRCDAVLPSDVGHQAIFIAFDARELATAQVREWRNTLIVLFALAAVLLATILTFFWYRRYQRSRLQLQEAMNRKEKLVALGHLAAGVAHEIRNPLSSIKGIAKYFAERTPQGGESLALAQVMDKEVDRLNRVVSELLELVKPAHLALQSVNLNDVISHSLQLVSQDAQSREIALHFAPNPNPSLCRVEADPDRLTQVLLNLYLNAIHAIGHQGTIQVEADECDGQWVKIEVRDNGKGIAPEQLQAIFTPYFTTKADGTGLGLAVVQNIIEQHGGTIQVTSVTGSGAIFTLYLPVKAKQQKD